MKLTDGSAILFSRCHLALLLCMKYFLANKCFVFFMFFSVFCIPTIQAACTQENDDCAPVSQWQFSVGLGVGALSNPLHGGKDIPLLIVPRISYYGKNIFFENNTLGYSFYENDSFTISVITQLNRDAAFFKRWHPSNIFVDTFLASREEELMIGKDDNYYSPDRKQPAKGVDDFITERNVRVRQQDIKKRKISLDGGLQFNWFLNNKSQLQGKILHNINSVYQGVNAQFAYLHKLKIQWLPNTLLHLTLGSNWFSREHVNYYYGVNSNDKVPSYAYYQGGSSFNPFVKLSSRYQLNKRWQFAVSYKQEWLGKAIHQSPLVAEKKLETLFIGAVYAF